MLIVWANNLTMVAGPGQVAVVTTDPHPLDGNDRLDATVNVHTIFNTLPPGLVFALEVSNDAVHFIPFGVIGDRNVPGIQPWVNSDAAWAFLRVVFTLSADAGLVAGVTFDCHMNIDKQG
jgi:hypothetical protein